MAYKGRVFKRNPGNEAFVYCRYSSDAQREVSIDQQMEAAREYAKSHDIKIVAFFKDRAKTGTSMERSGLQDMLYQARIKRPAYLLTWKLDRLSREIHDSFAIDAQLLDYGVELITIAEELPADMGMRYAVQGLYAAMAHSFILGHRENVLRGMRDNASHCLFNGNIILGYKGKPNEKYHVDKATAPVVKKIFKEYAEGKPMQVIANELNAAGVKTARGNVFTVSSLRHILVNRAYLGEYHWGRGDNKMVFPEGMPRLIDDELFEEVQKRLNQNKQGGKAAQKKVNPDAYIADFWLTGHIFCGECGLKQKNQDDLRHDNTMQGTSGLSHTGKRYYYYSCKHHRKHKCCLKDVRKEYVEGYVNFILNEILTDTELRMYIANACYIYYKETEGTSDSYEGSLVDSIKDVEKKLQNMIKAIEAGVFNEMTQEAMLRLKKEKQDLEDELDKERIRKQNALQLDDIIHHIDRFVRSNMGKRALFDMFIDKVIVFNDKIAVTFHYNDDRREMSMRDIISMIDNDRTLMGFVGKKNTLFGFSEDVPPDIIEMDKAKCKEESYFFA